MFAPHLLLHVAGEGVELHDLIAMGVIAFVVTSGAIQVAGGLLARRGAPGSAERQLEFAAWGAVVAAACSLGAATIHLAVIGEHLAEYALFGYAFALLAAFQIAWPVAYLAGRSTLLALPAILVNLGAMLVWLLSRTLGLPIGPTPGVPEPIGLADVIATGLELALVAVLVLGASRPARGALERLRLPLARVLLAGGYAVGGVGLATVVALVSLAGGA